MVRNQLVGMLAALALGALATRGAQAQESCGCALLPIEGAYGPTEADLRFTYMDGDDEHCPTRARLTGRRPEGPDVNVELTCPPGGDVWSGPEPMGQLGTFFWTFRAAAPEPGPIAGRSETATPAALLPFKPGMGTTRRLSVELKLSEMLHMIGKRDRKFLVSLQGGGKAPECLCARVRAERDFVAEMRRHYADRALLDRARDSALRGKLSEAKFWMDSDRKLHEFEAESPAERSYDDLVYAEYAEGVGAKTVPAEHAKQVEGPSEGPDPGAFAGHDPIDCEISMPSEDVVRESCEPDIVLLAALRHEQQHQRRCRRLNEPPTYTFEGETVNWKTGGDFATGMVMREGKVLPRSGYDAWGQNPANRSADEQASYAIEEELLTEYLEANCS